MPTRLSDVLREFAHTLNTDFPVQSILEQLVGRIVDVLPITSAGVTLISTGAPPRYVAASDESALRFEQLQTDLDEGPCLTAYSTAEAITVADLRRESRFPTFSAAALDAGLAAVFAFPLRHADRQLGALDLYRQTAGPLDDGDMAIAQTLADVTTAYIVNAETRAELERMSSQAQHRSLHDALTGLPNRTLLVERLDHAILRSRRSRKKVAILFADLDRFKSVNDTYGHHVGDQLLVAVTERLTHMLRPGDTLARLAGDEFIILCEDLDDSSAVEVLADRISSALAEPFLLAGGAAIVISASVGIAFAGLGEDVPEQVLRDADAAMYEAKRQGGGRHGLVDPADRRLADRRTALNSDLRHALARGELSLQYHPIVAISEGRVAGLEALLCWNHPAYGRVPPTTAILLAEQSGLIADIGQWVLRQACIDRHLHYDPTKTARLDISVNVSAHQLIADDFASVVANVLAETHTEPASVTLEMTESIFMVDSTRARDALNRVKQVGVKLALDDFGTGFSSLGYIDQVPVDVIKVDPTFVRDLDRTPSHHLIVGAIVGLAHGLGLTVVAEGIETLDAYRKVAELGCDSAQGYYFARPAPADSLDLWAINEPLRRTRLT